MKLTRRHFNRLAATGFVAAAAPRLFSPALAQDKPLKIGIIAPRSGVAGTAGECGIRAVQWATERMNKAGYSSPEKVLEITQMARRRAREVELAPSEPILRILACEIEAFSRLARFAEADAVVEEANLLAKRGNLVRYALAIPVARLYIFTNRVEKLASWADSLDGRYQALLQEIVPRMPRPWLEPELAFVLRKP